jgi:competence protein ComFC
VISFYHYEEIEQLLKSKYSPIGSKIYTMLSKNSFYPFLKAFDTHIKTNLIPIDDHLKQGYSHTAIIAKAAQTQYIKACYQTLQSKNTITYAGKDLDFRLQNPKEFIYRPKNNLPSILIDDIITTGTTLMQADEALKQKEQIPLFALTLATARHA